MITERIKHWMCVQCGYDMDALSTNDGSENVMGDGDVAICFNCGKLYTRKLGALVPLSDAEYRALPRSTRRELKQMERRRAAIVTSPLGRKPGSLN